MANTRADLLLHPVRLRIVLAVSGESLTTAQIAQRVSDVPKATLYRQIAVLADAGMLEVVGEEQKRGSVERTYRLVESEAKVGPEEAARMSSQEHLDGFVTFVGALIASFSRYIETGEADPSRDIVGYTQAPLWLTEDEGERLAASLSELVQPYLDNEPSGDRRRTLFNVILVPDATSG